MFESARFKPLVAPVLRRLGRTGVIDEQVLQPEERQSVRPPVLLPGMLERVTGTDEHSDLSYHMRVATAEQAVHAPLVRRIYRNALVSRTGFATWHMSERYAGRVRPRELMQPVTRVPRLRYCYNYVIWRYFGHWMTDALPASMIEPEGGALWMPFDPSWSDAQSYSALFDLPLLEAPLVVADELVVYQDFGQGSHKRARYETLRSALHARFGGTGGAPHLYLRRGATGVRRTISNEDALVEALVARGWVVLDIGQASVEELQAALCQAQVVASMEGSHLTHAQLSLRPGSSLVVLAPCDRFTTVHAGYCNANRVSFGMVVLEGTQEQGYRADIEDVLRTVDLTQQAASV